MQGVGAVAGRAQSIQSSGIEAGGIAIGATSGYRLFQFQPQLFSGLLRLPPKASVTGRALHWGAPEAAFYVKADTRCCRLKAQDGLAEAVSILLSGYPYIDNRLADGRHHIGGNPTFHHSHVHAYAFFRFVEGKQALDLIRELQNGAGALARVEAGMGGFASGH